MSGLYHPKMPLRLMFVIGRGHRALKRFWRWVRREPVPLVWMCRMTLSTRQIKLVDADVPFPSFEGDDRPQRMM